MLVGCSRAGVGPVETAAPSGSATASIAPLPSGLVVVDGFDLGRLAACSPPTDPKTLNSCATFQTLATSALNTREPSHADIASTQMYTDGSRPGPADVTGDASSPPGPPALATPIVYVFVFTLADGTVHAAGVECPNSGDACKGIGSYPTSSSAPTPTSN